MKKNTKVAQSAERKLQKKKELERISNKELIIFTVGLVAEVILMFFYSALRQRLGGSSRGARSRFSLFLSVSLFFRRSRKRRARPIKRSRA